MKVPTTALVRFFKAGVSLAGLVFAQILAAQSGAALDHQNPRVLAVIAVQNDVTADWMSRPAILGTAVGVDEGSDPVLLVFVDRNHTGMADAIRSLPVLLRGIGVRVEATDKFRSMVGKPGGGGGESHTAKQTPPIQLGTSGGWRNDLANGYCCGGTLGSLVHIGSTQYILSNYHVFESDIVPGGNGIVAKTTDPIIQPGLIDVGCVAGNAQNVATLVKKSSLPDSNVDCSIAQIVDGMVRTDGAILEIGTLSASTVDALLNQAVKKSGRTTGLSRSSVSGLNATVSVAYENECAGGSAFTVTYTGQIIIANRASRFLNSGDSGSLMVEDVATNPRAVGLLFAGSSSLAVANPIGDVLSFLGASMVGQ